MRSGLRLKPLMTQAVKVRSHVRGLIAHRLKIYLHISVTLMGMKDVVKNPQQYELLSVDL